MASPVGNKAFAVKRCILKELVILMILSEYSTLLFTKRFFRQFPTGREKYFLSGIKHHLV